MTGVKQSEEPVGVGLADAISQIRAELEQALREGKDSSIGFQAGPVELEFEVGFTKSREAGGGFQLSVLSLGAKGQGSSMTTHRVTVRLNPVDRTQPQLANSDEEQLAKLPPIVLR
jgi:Trypsin-co-occurring domain 2